MPLTNAANYHSAYRLLLNDLDRLCEYVEPTDGNAATFSHRLYELLLRASTEFESICKELLVAATYPGDPKDWRVTDYRTLEGSVKLEDAKAKAIFWMPSGLTVTPFAGWSTNSPPLAWYSDYNRVKHNREPEFKLANLSNVVTSVAAVFLLLARVAEDGFTESSWALGDGYNQLWTRRFVAQLPNLPAAASTTS